MDEDGQVHFAEAAALTPEDLAAVQRQVRARVLRWFTRAPRLEPADARDMAGWHDGGGFSLDAWVHVERNRAGLERPSTDPAVLRLCNELGQVRQPAPSATAAFGQRIWLGQ